MGDQHIAAFEHSARVAQLDALAFITSAAINRRSGRGGNKSNQIIKGNGHGRGIMKRRPAKA